MQRTFFILLFLACASCKEETVTPSNPVTDDFDVSQATLIKNGALVGVGHNVSGTAALYEWSGKKTVLLDPFSSQNGPDLKVYLSKDENATEYINLGAMKSTTGKQSYEVPGNPDVTDYKFVLIWCQQFSVLFGKAELK